MSIQTTDSQNNDANDIVYNEFCKTTVWLNQFDSLFNAIAKHYRVSNSMAAFILTNLKLKDRDALRFVRQFNKEIVDAYKGKAIHANDGNAIAHCVNILKETTIAPDESQIMSTLFDASELGVIELTVAAALLHELQQYLMVITNIWLDSGSKHDSESQNDIKDIVSILHAYKPCLQSYSTDLSEEDEGEVAKLRVLADLLKILGIKGFVKMVEDDELTVVNINKLLGLTGDDYSEKANDLVETVKNNFFYLRDDIKQAFIGKLVDSYAKLISDVSEMDIGMIGDAYWNKTTPHRHDNGESVFWRITACMVVVATVFELREDVVSSATQNTSKQAT